MLSKTFYIATLLLGTAASFALADYAISSPGTGVVWKAGDSVKVLWKASGNNIENKVDVRLVKGDASNLQLITNLCQDIDPTIGECDYSVSQSLTSGRDYAIEVGKLSANFGYSSFFSIQASGDLSAPTGCPNFGGQNCPQSLPCCSSSGYCGATDAYCGNGCMAKYSFNGQCVLPGAASAVTSAAPSVASAAPSATSAADSAADSVTSAAPSATSAADSAADSVTSAAPSATNAVDSAADSVTSAADPVPTQALDSEPTYGKSHKHQHPRPDHKLPTFLQNLDPSDPKFANNLSEDIDNNSKKFLHNPHFNKYSQKRRRGILRQ